MVINVNEIGSSARFTSLSVGVALWFYGELSNTYPHANMLMNMLYGPLIAEVHKFPITISKTLLLISLTSQNSGYYFCFARLRNETGYSIAVATLKVYGKCNV